MGEVGRPSDLTDEMFAKIKVAILDGKNLKQIAEESEMSYSTITDWTYRNYRNITDKIEGWKRDRKLILAEKNIEEMLQMNTKNIINNNGKLVEQTDVGLVRVKADLSKFTVETLGKKNYSKNVGITDGEGNPFSLVIQRYGEENNEAT